MIALCLCAPPADQACEQPNRAGLHHNAKRWRAVRSQEDYIPRGVRGDVYGFRSPLEWEIVIKENEAFYTPKAGFTGTDKFKLVAAGSNPFARPSARNGQLEVTVTVEAAP